MFNEDLAAHFKMKKQDFTRNRKQPFLSTLLFMINLLRKTLGVEIDGFIRHLNDRMSINVSYFTSSAFIQNRKKISPSVFKHLTSLIKPERDGPFKGKGYNRKSTIEVRLIRVDLPGGEIEILITTLLDSKKYPTKIFKKLYFMRWGVETFYDELKNKLKVEHLSGYSDNTIQHDLYCAVFISNLQSVIVNGLNKELEGMNENRQHDYKVNANLSYGFLKNRVLELLYQKAPIDKVFSELEELFLKHTIPIKNDRKNTRETQKYRYKDKPFITKNQKNGL